MKQDDQNPESNATSLADDLYDNLQRERELSAQQGDRDLASAPLADVSSYQRARLASITPVAAVVLGERMHSFFIALDEAGGAVFATWSGDRLFAMKGDATTSDHLSALRQVYGEGLVIDVQKVMGS